MSLVLEALRRVEKRDVSAGSVGTTVASYRPAQRKTHALVPLLLGLGTGGLAVFLLGTRANESARPVLSSPDEASPPAASPAYRPKGRAGLPPPIFPPPESGATAPRAKAPMVAKPAPAPSAVPSPVALILQAISERDSHPIAIINDQLVREGDVLGKIRVLKIGPESVEVLLENGTRDTVRFPPPPRPAEPEPTPEQP